MNINLTLFVQIFNFLIAYFIISRFFLKPALTLVQVDINRNQSLLSSITKEDQKLFEKQNLKKSNWKIFQNYFFSNKPDLSKTSEFIEVKFKQLEKKEDLDKNQIDQIATKISNELKSKVIHD